MKKIIISASAIILLIILLFPILLSSIASAGKAGVGVLNVPPEYRKIRLVQQDNNIRIYLTLSDYNSWEDIYKVDVILEYYGSERARFTFKQYEDTSSYVKINEFSDNSQENDLLQEIKSSYSHSDKKETVDDRCNFDLLFVFRTTWFTQIKIITSDREGLEATTHVDYDTEEMMRSSNMIMIPGIDEPIPVGVSSLMLNILAIFVAAAGVIYFTKKMKLIGGRASSYENPEQ